jgi:hypothetical protein
MSEEQEVLLLATRYPSSQFSDNIPFMLHRFNMLQRHSWMVYLTPKIERIISLLSTSPEGEVRCRCQNGMAYKD